jgi:hypothetical protein
MAPLPLVHFASVLGIQRNTLAYRTPYHYTPFLAWLVWIGRLLMLEYALQGHATNQLQHVRRVQCKYLCRGSAYPISWLIEAKAYGRAIARREGGRTNISWSLDRQSLELEGQSITLTAFAVWFGLLFRLPSAHYVS